MAGEFHVGVRGESFDNPDGTSRQEIIKTLDVGERVELIADPLNKHDKWAVGVFTTGGQQIGFLPSDARDSMTLLRGEPIKAIVARLIGGTSWFRRTIQGKKHVGVILKVTKPFPDWSRTEQLNNLAKPFDDAVKAARELEKSGDLEGAIDAYRAVVGDIADFTESNKFASAHRREASPVDRLSLLLEKTKRYEEARTAIIDWQTRFDPIELKSEAKKSTLKRKERLHKRLASGR